MSSNTRDAASSKAIIKQEGAFSVIDKPTFFCFFKFLLLAHHSFYCVLCNVVLVRAFEY